MESPLCTFAAQPPPLQITVFWIGETGSHRSRTYCRCEIDTLMPSTSRLQFIRMVFQLITNSHEGTLYKADVIETSDS